jgi:prepilin-type N-terminal cleavage/methylation domain-containing protein
MLSLRAHHDEHHGPALVRHGVRARGFTLLEIMIAIVLLSLMIAVVAPSLGALSGARLKETASLMGGLVRDTYARTALRGKSSRVVFDLEGNAFWVEEADTVVRVKQSKVEADRDGKAHLDEKDDRIKDIEADTKDEKEREKLAVYSAPGFKRVDGEDGQPRKLPPDVHFKSVWVEHLDAKVTGGQVALYFYPGGYTEDALITLTDDDTGERTLTVDVSALTGEISIEQEEPRIPDAQP